MAKNESTRPRSSHFLYIHVGQKRVSGLTACSITITPNIALVRQERLFGITNFVTYCTNITRLRVEHY